MALLNSPPSLPPNTLKAQPQTQIEPKPSVNKHQILNPDPSPTVDDINPAVPITGNIP